MRGGLFGEWLSRSGRSYNPDCDDDPDQKDLEAFLREQKAMSEKDIDLPDDFGLLKGVEKMPDGTFMDYVQVPADQYRTLTAELAAARKRIEELEAALRKIVSPHKNDPSFYDIAREALERE